MKKLTFFIACALALGNLSAETNSPVRSRDEAYDPLVREGKIWWYAQSQSGGRLTEDNDYWTMEYGFTFEGEDYVTAQDYLDAGYGCGPIRDEGPWNKLVVIRQVEVYKPSQSINFYDTPFPAHYLKEEDKVVRALDGVPNTRLFDRDFLHFYGLSYFFSWNNSVLKMLPRLYDFTDNEDDLLIGDEGEYLALKFKSKERKDFFGTERLVKTFVKPKLSRDEWSYDPLYRVWEGSEIEITEGIGLTAIRNTRNDFRNDPNELFFAPYTYVPDIYPCALGHGWFFGCREPMQLRYVTDMDYNIIYEGIGGIKAWELDPSGVEDVSADASAEEEWYTLGGVRISKPTQAGVYIHRIGSRTEKIAIR